MIDEAGGTTDRILFGTGISSSDITLSRAGSADLVIDIAGASPGQIIVKDQFTTNGALETLEFAASTTITLANVNYTQYGTDNADTLVGVTLGGGINDTIYGDDGNDTISGDTGDDTLYGDAGKDVISGGNGNDTIHGGSDNDVIHGGNGNNILYGDAGDDTIDAGTGNDAYYYTSGNDVYDDTSGTDTIYIPSGFTSAGTVYYKIGNDLKIILDTTNSILVKGQFSGHVIETVNFNGTAVTLSTVSYVTQGDDTNNTLNGSSGIDNLYGMGGNDTINGGNGNDRLYGGTGNDTLNGDNNDDFLDGGAGDDTIKGGSGNDTYYYVSGHDYYEETSGTNVDTVEFAAGWTLADLTFRRDTTSPDHLLITINTANSILLKYEFSAGTYTFETLKFSDTSTLNLLTYAYTTYGTASGETINGIAYNASPDDTIYAGGGNDTVNGNNGNDLIFGEDGNDTLNGNNNDDTLNGGLGNDTLNGGSGNDIYVYTAGLDSVTDSGGTDTLKIMGSTINDLSYTVSGSNTTFIINSGTDQILVNSLAGGTSSLHVDTILFEDGFQTTLPDYASWTNGTSGADTLTGTSVHNTIIGKAGNDTLDGAGGNDNVHGGAGDDIVKGGTGDDFVHGGEDNDTVYGQDGLDTLYGGTGNDTFVFEAASAFNNIDVIKDFDTAHDAINISDLLTGYTSGLSDIANFASLSVSGGNTSLLVDRDGLSSTYTAQSVVSIAGVTGLDIHDMLNNGHLIAA